MSISYSEYLELDTLLSIQKERATPAAEDESLFIIIHQTYELWFKQILTESQYLCSDLKANNVWQATHTLHRIRAILKVLVHQTDILETMTPQRFARFRDFLGSSSGLQSYQFRELEIICGWQNHPASYHHFSASIQKQLQQRAQTPTLWESFHALLKHYDDQLPALTRNSKSHGLKYVPEQALQTHILQLLQTHPAINMLIERLVDVDEGIQEWRYRHVKMVERIIGTQPGSGGTGGVAYLKKTLHRQIFPDLWSLRSHFSTPEGGAL